LPVGQQPPQCLPAISGQDIERSLYPSPQSLQAVLDRLRMLVSSGPR
jgi:hypothetical protein